MGRVLVGIDGSKASEHALAWASEYVVAGGGQLVAGHAVRRPYSEIAPDDAERLVDERRDRLERDWLGPALELGLAPESVVAEGDPRVLLLAVAEDLDAELLVVGRSGAGGPPGFLHVGSVVEHLAHHARWPLAVIPSDSAGHARRVLLGVDGSPESAAAIGWCARMAAVRGSSVVAVTVAEPIAEWTPSWSPDNWRRDTERDMHGWLAPLAAAGVSYEPVVVEELHPVDGLLRTAADRDADLVVVGTRGAGGFTGLRFGGVALKVLHHAELPLVLVPPAEE